jgi:ATP-dependent RNA helicase
MDEHRLLRKLNPQIVFATPGRLNDHLDKQNLSAKSVEYLVIDEFDKCLEMGFRDEMIRLVGKLDAVKRRILLSATESEIIPRFVNMQHIERIDYRKENKQLDNRLSFFRINSPEKDKLPTLRNLLLTLGEQSSIVFLNYRDAVERTATFLCEQGFAVSMFHGGLEQSYREAALYKFSNGAANIMVSTNLGARGLDIPDVENIINYHIPENEEEYVHRIGRTARWNKTGNTFFILNYEEQIPEYVREEMQEYSFPVELPKPALARMVILYIGKGKKDNISKGDVLGFLCKKGGLNSSDVGRIDVKERYTYAAVNCSKLSQVLRLTKGEKIKGINTLVEEVV